MQQLADAILEGKAAGAAGAMKDDSKVAAYVSPEPEQDKDAE